ncbi:hypothetical protein JXJ21_03215 [candidate division KSB1 bacterium]|nr:hypothetical protein [candidate division KSB1 bacterium]
MSWTTKLIWAIYISLLAVLFPHTAWFFSKFEPFAAVGNLSAWFGAFAFEASIAALTHKLAKHIDQTPKRISARAKFRYRYLNAFSLGLVTSVAISALANLSHAVEFGQNMAIIDGWGIEPKVYQFAAGGILPLVSLLFARILSNVTETEDEEIPELTEAKGAVTDLRKRLRDSEAQRADLEERAKLAEQRFDAAGDLFASLFAEEKRQRILAAAQKWPRLPASAISIIADASPSYVSEVLNAPVENEE